MRAVVEQVIQTASRVLEGELEGREAVTILATLSRDAVTAGEKLSRTDPERASTYQQLLAALIQELEARGDGGRDADEQARYVVAVAEDLAKVRRSLTPG